MEYMVSYPTTGAGSRPRKDLTMRGALKTDMLIKFADYILRLNRMEEGGIITIKECGSQITCYSYQYKGFTYLAFRDNGSDIGDMTKTIAHISKRFAKHY